MNAPATASAGSGAWRRVPLGLRVGGLCCGCFLLVAAAVYLVGAVAMRLASLTVALVAAVLIAALLEPVVTALVRLRVSRGLAALSAVLLFLVAMISPAVVLWRVARDQFGDIANRPFVPEVPIGRVTSVEPVNGALTRTAVVAPYVRFSTVDIVGVVVATPHPPKRDSLLPPKPTPTPPPSPTPATPASSVTVSPSSSRTH